MGRGGGGIDACFCGGGTEDEDEVGKGARELGESASGEITDILELCRVLGRQTGEVGIDTAGDGEYEF